MDYTIYRGSTPVITARPIDGAVVRKVMAEHIVRFNLELPESVDFQIRDTITVWKETFNLNRLPEVTKSDDKKALIYTYNFQFEARFYDLAKIIVLGLDANNLFTKVNHTLTGTADAFIDLIIYNANGRGHSGWTKGVVAQTHTVTRAFAGENCLEILSWLAQEFDLEWWVKDQVIYLGMQAKTSGLKFEYGKGKGLYKLIRTNLDASNVVTRLIVEGGTKNLRGDYRNFSNRLLIPESAGPWLEKNIDKFGIIEHTETFEDIFPNRAGTITNVIDKYTFSDSTLEFNVNDYLLPGITATIGFDTGPLSGYELELASFDNATKTFVVNKNEDEKALEIPSDVIHAQRGDRYKIFNIEMPQNYVDLAETELQAAAQSYLDKNSIPRVMYAVEPDRLLFKRKGIRVNLGDYANIADEPMDVDVNPRMVATEQDMHEETYYHRIEFSENVSIPAIVRQYAAQDLYRQTLLTRNLSGLTSMVRTTPIKPTPTKYDISLYTGFVAGTEYGDNANDGITADRPLYWQEENTIKLSGIIIQPSALSSGQRRGSALPAFNLAIRPKTQQRCPVQVKTSLYTGTGSMRITVEGDAYITFTTQTGELIRESLIYFIDLAGANFTLL